MKRYAIITTESVYHEGDERSRTHPGHGYPAYTSRHEKFNDFGEDRGKWEARIRELANPVHGQPEKFRAIVYEEAEVTTSVSVDIGS